MATKKQIAAPAVISPELIAAITAALGQGAAPVKSQGDLANGLTVTVSQNGKSWVSKNGNPMISVRGTLPNGAKVGGTLWIKV